MADRYVRNVLQWVSDKQSITATVSDQKRITESIADIRKAGDTAYDRRVQQIADEQKRATSSIADIRRAGDQAYDKRVQQLAGENDMRRTQESLTRQAFSTGTQQLTLTERLAQAEKERTNAAKSGITAQDQMLDSLRKQAGFVDSAGRGTVPSGGRSAGQRITGAGRALFNAPDIGGVSTPIARGLIAGGAAVDKLGLSLGQVGALAGVAGIGLGLVAVALENFNKQIAASKRLLDAALAANKNYYAALAELTTAQASEQIAELQRVRPLLEQNATGLRESVESTFKQLQAQLGDVGARVAFQTGAYKELEDAALEAEAALEENIQTETRLMQGREAGAFATNDAAARERELAAARANAQTETANLILAVDRMTAEERAAREAQIRRDLELLRIQLDNVALEGAARLELGTQYNKLTNELHIVSEVTDTYGDQLQREAEAKERALIASEALADSTDAYFEALEWEVDARQKMADITAEINRIETERIAKLNELAVELSTNQTELWRKAGEDVLAAEDKAQEAREKQQEQHWKRVKEINDRAFAAQSNAIAARDVLAYYLSRKQQAEDLKREEEANEDRLKQIDDALEDQKDVIAKRLKEQLVTLEANYRKQVDATNDAARKATDIQRAAYREQEVALQSAIMAQRNITLAAQQIRSGDELRHQTLLTEITRNGAQYIETLWLNLMNAMIAGMPAGGGSQFPPLIIGGGPGGGGGPLPTPYTPGVAGGSLPSAAAAARNSGGVNIALTVHGVSEEAVIREVTSNIREAYRRLG